MATSSDEMKTKPSWRRYEDGNSAWDKLTDKIFNQDRSHKCPTYVHKTPPCQGSCPSGEDIRGWLQIVRGMEQPPKGMDWREYAFRRSTDANPFPSLMGRVCPAPCQDGCNRNELEDFVGINAVEQFIGDTAIANGYRFDAAPALSGKRVAIVGGGPAGLAAAYQLRRRGHACTIFEANEGLGGMFRFGIPGYRVPRDKLDAEIQRILDLGQIEVKLKTRVGTDVTVEQLEKDYDAILWSIGCQSGRGLPVPGWKDTPNCVSGVAFLKAYNEGRMKVTARQGGLRRRRRYLHRRGLGRAPSRSYHQDRKQRSAGDRDPRRLCRPRRRHGRRRRGRGGHPDLALHPRQDDGLRARGG